MLYLLLLDGLKASFSYFTKFFFNPFHYHFVTYCSCLCNRNTAFDLISTLSPQTIVVMGHLYISSCENILLPTCSTTDKFTETTTAKCDNQFTLLLLIYNLNVQVLLILEEGRVLIWGRGPYQVKYGSQKKDKDTYVTNTCKTPLNVGYLQNDIVIIWRLNIQELNTKKMYHITCYAYSKYVY